MNHNIVEENIFKLKCSLLIQDTLGFWYDSKTGNCVEIFEKVMNLRNFKWEENGEIVDLDTEEVLIRVIDRVNMTIIAQIVCYAFEIACMSGENFESNSCFFKGKENVYVSDDINNDYKLLNFIRNAIAHNDDMKESELYSFSYDERMYTFVSNKDGYENSKVVIGKKELFEFLNGYITSLNIFNNIDYLLDINKKDIYSSKEIDDVRYFICIKDKRFFNLDDNQIFVIKDMINYLRNNKVESHKCVNFCYPYKCNVVNNYLRAFDFYYLVSGIYFHKENTYSQYMKFLLNYGTYYDRDIKQKHDIPGMFLMNRLFQIFSSTDKMVIDRTRDIFEENRFNKLRNSVIHGTYYKDFYGDFYFYDASRSRKNEEGLKFITKLSVSELSDRINKFSLSKKIEKESNVEYKNEKEFYEKFLKNIYKRFKL